MASDTSKYLQTHILWKNKVDGINVCYLLRRNSGSNNKVRGDKVLFPEILQIPFTRKTLNWLRRIRKVYLSKVPVIGNLYILIICCFTLVGKSLKSLMFSNEPCWNLSYNSIKIKERLYFFFLLHYTYVSN